MSTESSPQLATAVDVTPLRPAPPQLLGIAIGVIGMAAFAHVLLQWELRNVRDTWRGFGFEPGMLPRLTTSSPWVVGVPLAAVLAIGALCYLRPRSFAVPLALAVVFVGALLSTWYLPTLPFREIAGNIK